MEKKLELIKETILLGESLITEAKKIGIDKLPYGYDSLTRFIDVKTMNVHYNKHYKGYVKKLNDALSKKDYGNVELEDIIKSITKYPKVIRNNGGGAYNHSLFWKMLSPEKQTIKGEILTKINKEFGSYKEFKKKFEEESIGRFGSGWAWLVLTKNNRLKIMTTPNQDNPQMNDIDGGGFPLLGLDLWEHAYYLEYQNKRDEYIRKFWDVVNWEFVNDVYLSKLKTKLKESIKSNNIVKETKSNEINFTYDSLEDFPEDFEFILENGRINPKVFEVMLRKVYPKCSPEIIEDYDETKHISSPCYGKIQTIDCDTNYGVIGGKFAVSQRGGIGEWSVINWFDANTKVSDKILEYFKKYNKEGSDFISWFFRLKKTLLSEDGMFTGELANFIMNPQTKKGTLDYGLSRESLAIEILNKKYGNSNITKFCDGDVRDKYKGQDMKLTREDISEYVQVKPTKDLYETKIDGQLKYIFKSKNKYKPEYINIFAFVDNIKNYVFFDFKNVKVKDEGEQSKERYSYFFNPEDIKFKSPNLYIKKIQLTESKSLKVVITENQKLILEKLLFKSNVSLINQLCDYKGDKDSVYCKLLNLVDSIPESERNEIIDAANILIDFYYPTIYTKVNTREELKNMVYNKGIIPKILNVALNSDLPGNFLKIISKFILDSEFDEKETKKALEDLKSSYNISTKNLDEFLREIRYKKYTKYEESLEGTIMKKFSTSLSINYKCGTEKTSFLKEVKKIFNNPEKEKEFIGRLIYCIKNNMESVNSIKADLVSSEDLYYQGEKIFNAGDYFEVKMMNTNVDSYLSEFFSIFKSSEISDLKTTHLEVYNRIIDEIFKYFKYGEGKQVGDKLLNKIEQNLSGMFFENNILVPMDMIKIYWSNKGQPGCKEKRLSIRFKIIKSGRTYIFNPQSNVLELNTKPISNLAFKEVICP